MEKSGNVDWAISLYHNRCRIKYWEMFIQRPSRKAHAQNRQRETSHTVTNTTLIAAEVQFFTLLQEKINDGKFKSIKDLEESYVETMESYGITSASLPRRVLEKKIKQNVQNVLITQSYGNKPPQVHSQDAAKAAINAKAARQKHKQCPLCLNVLKISDLLSNLN